MTPLGISGISIDTIKSIDAYIELLKAALNFAKDYEKIRSEAAVEKERIAAQKSIFEQQILANIVNFEKELNANTELKKMFIEGANNAINDLIEHKQYELANLFHERLVDSFDGNSIGDLLAFRKKFMSFGTIRIE